MQKLNTMMLLFFFLPNSNVDFDLNVNNVIGIRNTFLLRSYAFSKFLLYFFISLNLAFRDCILVLIFYENLIITIYIITYLATLSDFKASSSCSF